MPPLRYRQTACDLLRKNPPDIMGGRAIRGPPERVRGVVPADCQVLSLAKGLENESSLRPTEILHQVLRVRHLAVLSGPSHAEEVARNLPTSVAVASEDLPLARWIQQHFSTDR